MLVVASGETSSASFPIIGRPPPCRGSHQSRICPLGDVIITAILAANSTVTECMPVRGPGSVGRPHQQSTNPAKTRIRSQDQQPSRARWLRYLGSTGEKRKEEIFFV